MARFSGVVGYNLGSVETPPNSGIYRETIVEKTYRGDVLRDNRRPGGGDKVNENVSLDNQISIVVDPYAIEHFSMIKYVRWGGSLWNVTSVEFQRPRVIMTIGGVYNGATPPAPSDPA